MPGETWQQNFRVPALAKCMNVDCETMVWTDTAHVHRVYCEPCRKEARSIDDKNYMDRRGRRLRKERERARQRQAVSWHSEYVCFVFNLSEGADGGGDSEGR